MTLTVKHLEQLQSILREKLTVTVYRPTGQPILLNNTDTLSIPELFPGWELPVSEIWPPVFE